MGWIGGTIGFLVGSRFGALSAILGAVIGNKIGNFLGEGAAKLADGSSRAQRSYGNARGRASSRASSSREREIVFLTAVGAMLAKLAKADGHVDESEIAAAEQAFERLGLTPGNREICIRAFRAAKTDYHTIFDYAESFAAVVRGVVMRELMYDILWDVACADGEVSAGERRILEMRRSVRRRATHPRDDRHAAPNTAVSLCRAVPSPTELAPVFAPELFVRAVTIRNPRLRLKRVRRRAAPRLSRAGEEAPSRPPSRPGPPRRNGCARDRADGAHQQCVGRDQARSRHLAEKSISSATPTQPSFVSNPRTISTQPSHMRDSPT